MKFTLLLFLSALSFFCISLFAAPPNPKQEYFELPPDTNSGGGRAYCGCPVLDSEGYVLRYYSCTVDSNGTVSNRVCVY